MFQGFPQFRIAFLDLLEQAHILDSDHRLISEGLDERNLLVSKWPNFLSDKTNRTDWHAFPQQRNSEHRSITVLRRSASRKISRNLYEVRKVNDLTLGDGSSVH